jgi:hypothetical protein
LALELNELLTLDDGFDITIPELYPLLSTYFYRK